MDSSPSPFSTPKRKHSQLSHVDSPVLNTARFSFEAGVAAAEDGSNSPRTKVAHKFRDLALDEGAAGAGGVRGRVGSPIPAPPASPYEAATRKRMRLPSMDASPANPRPSTTGGGGPPEAAGQQAVFEGPKGEWATGLEAVVDGAVLRDPQTNSHLRRSYPSINRLADSKSRRKRASTPPRVGSKTKADADPGGGGGGDADAEVVEPVRASLTWREDEITVYDPDDEDDDGTGINGIGFKPTPAIAYARTVKRKQQLAEYRKREEREARAKRSQRRRGSPGADALEDKASSQGRKAVHFSEFEPQPVATT